MAPSRGTKRGHKPPSRIRYEESHPVVSFRVKKEIHQQLMELLAKSGKPIGDFFREALAIQRADTSKSYQRGYQEGYQEAKQLYCVVYRCNVCGQAMQLASANEKAAGAQYMEEHRWGHGACHKGQ